MNLDNKLSLSLTILAIVMVIFIGAQAYNTVKSSEYIGKDIITNNTILIDATGEAFGKPDVAQVNVSVVKKAYTVLEAQKAHAESMNKVIQYLKESGIEEKDIKTTNYNIYPQYDYLKNQGSVFRGYEITQTLQVKIRNLDKVGEILGGVTNAGANQVGGVNFVIDDEDALVAEARKQAIEKAKSKADQLAEDLDVKIVRLVSFSESNGASPYYKNYEAYGLGGEIASAPSPELPAGENQINVTVYLTYEIK